jgi:hypothetical protein
MRIKLDKILVHIGLEICMLSKSMPALGTFVSYWIHSSLSSCCIENWAFSEKSIYIIANLLSVFISLHAYTQKHLYYYFPVKLANQYLQLLVDSTTFYILKDATIDLLHLGVITQREWVWRWLAWCRVGAWWWWWLIWDHLDGQSLAACSSMSYFPSRV